MKELMKRVFANPAIATELLVATLFINILAMASPLFVMQVLNRYVSQGVDATLITLTTGVLLAIVLEFLFRQARSALARGVNVAPDEKLAIAGYAILTKAKAGDLEQIPPETRREMVNGMASVEHGVRGILAVSMLLSHSLILGSISSPFGPRSDLAL